ncbi:hypothetical protein SAMN05192575_103256 [Nocardioides alpinus]|uniref:Tetratricopeptide repeat-containing protein n=1 Tax=Nocardioides alpinus TaxID=748909 RepID=A0A1I0Y5B9_9ACTN|nr:hypothetical protein [Nocardioides alpinus]PKH39049.1 hypothetical protein CXG46_15105 [Nocardioides alpinus]SFB08412.1 hypothetical protein SAMN05192575_103256 [Nocardioides alpinus]
MRTLIATTAFVVAALAGGCTGASEPRESDARPSAETSESSGAETPVVDSEACEEVRTGIDAFNLGDFDETVERFEAALPLAEEQDDGSTRARELVEAVRYYAELDAEAYPEAARTSPEFAKYKAITLGQCVPVGSDAPESPGTDV